VRPQHNTGGPNGLINGGAESVKKRSRLLERAEGLNRWSASRQERGMGRRRLEACEKP
jgi:hypothetical protein